MSTRMTLLRLICWLAPCRQPRTATPGRTVSSRSTSSRRLRHWSSEASASFHPKGLSMDEHPLMAMMLRSSNVLGNVENMEENLKPLPYQYELKPGDVGLIATGNTPMDHDLVIAKILDPEQVGGFNDWVIRVQKSYVLCDWRAIQDYEGDIGWFSRVRFVQITPEQYAEVAGWMDRDELPETLPEWLTKVYVEYTQAVHAQAPDRVPQATRCEKCGKSSVELHVRQMTKISARAGDVEKDGQHHYTMVSDQEFTQESTVHLHCTECGHRKHIHDHEYDI